MTDDSASITSKDFISNLIKTWFTLWFLSTILFVYLGDPKGSMITALGPAFGLLPPYPNLGSIVTGAGDKLISLLLTFLFTIVLVVSLLFREKSLFRFIGYFTVWAWIALGFLMTLGRYT